MRKVRLCFFLYVLYMVISQVTYIHSGAIEGLKLEIELQSGRVPAGRN